MRLRAVIADDEPLARERVRLFAAEEQDVEVIAECADGAATVKAVEQLKPDLLFLDVQMPRLNGFEVLELLGDKAMPAVIFTTAYDQHAIRAFEVNAIDYLLKPFKQERFRKALQRARGQLNASSQGIQQGVDPRLASLLEHLRGAEGAGGRILVKSPDRILFLRPREIDYVEADGNYVHLHVAQERHMIRETMASMEARLKDAGFMRVSRSAMVNLSRVREVKPLGAGEYCILLQNGARLGMTCPLRELQERLERI